MQQACLPAFDGCSSKPHHCKLSKKPSQVFRCRHQWRLWRWTMWIRIYITPGPPNRFPGVSRDFLPIYSLPEKETGVFLSFIPSSRCISTTTSLSPFFGSLFFWITFSLSIPHRRNLHVFPTDWVGVNSVGLAVNIIFMDWKAKQVRSSLLKTV